MYAATRIVIGIVITADTPAELEMMLAAVPGTIPDTRIAAAVAIVTTIGIMTVIGTTMIGTPQGPTTGTRDGATTNTDVPRPMDPTTGTADTATTTGIDTTRIVTVKVRPGVSID